MCNTFDLVIFCVMDAAVNTAINAWRLALTGRFRLLDQWCAFVQVYVLLKHEHLHHPCVRISQLF
jgi:hypothetical protein